MKYFLLVLFLMLSGNVAADNCAKPRDDFDSLYCLNKIYIETDKELNTVYTELRSTMGYVEKARLRNLQLDWIKQRNARCGLKKDGQFYVSLSCVTNTTEHQISVLRKKLRECKAVGCGGKQHGKVQKIGPFTARYYSESAKRLVASETVVRPAINYPYAQFHGIDARDFYAVWEGEINLGDSEQSFAANFDVSWSELAFYVDGELVLRWSNSNQKIPVSLSPGPHTVRIEYHNNWHTVGFNASFVSYPLIPASNAKNFLAEQIDGNSDIIYIGAYESADRYNKVLLKMPRPANKVFLFLSSYESINWVLDSSLAAMVSGIAVSSHGGSSTISNIGDDTPVYDIKGVVSGYKNSDSIKGRILNIAGREPVYVFGKYSVSSVLIPKI